MLYSLDTFSLLLTASGYPSGMPEPTEESSDKVLAYHYLSTEITTESLWQESLRYLQYYPLKASSRRVCYVLLGVPSSYGACVIEFAAPHPAAANALVTRLKKDQYALESPTEISDGFKKLYASVRCTLVGEVGDCEAWVNFQRLLTPKPLTVLPSNAIISLFKSIDKLF